MTHEKKVEKFYTYGSKKRALQDSGFLSFGFWHDDRLDYSQAADALINKVLQFEKRDEESRILNVACGYGAETVRIYEKIHPEKIIAIDITQEHINFAKSRIECLNLSEKITFDKMDACKVSFNPSSFDYIIGIEGPAHFNTREDFLKKAYSILNVNGVLLLSDIMVNRHIIKKNLYNRLIGKICSKFWLMPRKNWMSMCELMQLLEKTGFKIDYAESTGHNVFPGFSKFNLKWKSIKNAISTRGFFIGMGLTIISWLLGHVYRRDLIDYVVIRAIKI